MLGVISTNSHFALRQRAQHEEPQPPPPPEPPPLPPDVPGEYIEKGFPPSRPAPTPPPETREE